MIVLASGLLFTFPSLFVVWINFYFIGVIIFPFSKSSLSNSQPFLLIGGGGGRGGGGGGGVCLCMYMFLNIRTYNLLSL